MVVTVTVVVIEPERADDRCDRTDGGPPNARERAMTARNGKGKGGGSGRDAKGGRRREPIVIDAAPVSVRSEPPGHATRGADPDPVTTASVSIPDVGAADPAAPPKDAAPGGFGPANPDVGDASAPRPPETTASGDSNTTEGPAAPVSASTESSTASSIGGPDLPSSEPTLPASAASSEPDTAAGTAPEAVAERPVSTTGAPPASASEPDAHTTSATASTGPMPASEAADQIRSEILTPPRTDSGSPPPPPSPSNSSGFDLRLPIAAAVGGLIGIGGSFLLALGGSWPTPTATVSPDRARIVALENRLAEAEKRTTAPAAAPAAAAVPAARIEAIEAALQERDRRIEALQTEIRAARAAPAAGGATAGVDPARVEALEAKFLADIATARGQLTQALDAARAELAGAVKRLDERVAAAAARTDALERTTAERIAAETKALGDRIAGSQSALEARLGELGSALQDRSARLDRVAKGLDETTQRLAGYEDLRKTVDVLFARVAGFEELRRKTDALAQDLQAATAGSKQAETARAELVRAVEAERAALADLRGRLDGVAVKAAEVDRLAGGLKAAADRTAAVESRFTGFSDRIGDIEAAAKRGADARTDAVLALSLGSLKAAVDDGRPFGTELATARTLGRGTVDLAALEGHAARGVPTTAALIDRFPVVAKAILQATAPAASGGIVDRLLSNAGQAVSIRKVGEVGGDGPEALVARMEERLKARDLTQALSAWKMLPEAGRKASADWAAALETRATVDRALATVTASVLDKLVQTGQ